MVAPVIVVIDEGCDLRLQVTWQIIVFQQDSVLERLVIDAGAVDGCSLLGLQSARMSAGQRPSARMCSAG